MGKKTWDVIRTAGTIIIASGTISSTWGLVQLHVFDAGSKVSNDPHMLSNLYVAGITLGIGTLVAINWELWSRYQARRQAHRQYPANQLQSIATYCHSLSAGLHHGFDMAMLSGSDQLPIGGDTEILIRKVVHVLDDIGVQHPPMDDAEQWVLWLPKLTAWAELRDIKGAKAYKWKPVEKL